MIHSTYLSIGTNRKCVESVIGFFGGATDKNEYDVSNKYNKTHRWCSIELASMLFHEGTRMVIPVSFCEAEKHRLFIKINSNKHTPYTAVQSTGTLGSVVLLRGSHPRRTYSRSRYIASLNEQPQRYSFVNRDLQKKRLVAYHNSKSRTDQISN
jgi:hypothetical protein